MRSTKGGLRNRRRPSLQNALRVCVWASQRVGVEVVGSSGKRETAVLESVGAEDICCSGWPTPCNPQRLLPGSFLGQGRQALRWRCGLRAQAASGGPGCSSSRGNVLQRDKEQPVPIRPGGNLLPSFHSLSPSPTLRVPGSCVLLCATEGPPYQVRVCKGSGLMMIPAP